MAESMLLDKYITERAIYVQEPSKAELIQYEYNQEAMPSRKAFAIIQCWPQIPLAEVIVELGAAPPCVSFWQEVVHFLRETALRLSNCSPRNTLRGLPYGHLLPDIARGHTLAPLSSERS